jgi:hypothetical protein
MEMALTLIVTPGGSNSNAYVTIEDSDNYFESVSHFHSVWTALTEQEKMAKIISATRAIDRFNFLYPKYYPDQALKFPTQLDAVEIPEEVKSATCEMIMFQHFNADSATGQMGREIEEVKVDGVVAIKYRQIKPMGQDSAFGGNLDSIKALLVIWIGQNGIRFVK